VYSAPAPRLGLDEASWQPKAQAAVGERPECHSSRGCHQRTPTGQSFLTAGGFDDAARRNKALVVENTESGPTFSIGVDYRGNHGEADTRVFLHARLCPLSPILIYSPDSDVSEIGLLNISR
jgi:hypothetical protein